MIRKIALAILAGMCLACEDHTIQIQLKAENVKLLRTISKQHELIQSYEALDSTQKGYINQLEINSRLKSQIMATQDLTISNLFKRSDLLERQLNTLRRNVAADIRFQWYLSDPEAFPYENQPEPSHLQ